MHLSSFSQEDIEDMDKFIQGTILKDYPDMEKTTEECTVSQNEENPSVVKVEISKKRPFPHKQSNQVC